MKAEIIRKSGSTIVNVQPPEKIQQVSEAQRQSRVWANVATAIASEIPTTASVDALVSEPSPEPEANTCLSGLLAHVDSILGITDEPVEPPVTPELPKSEPSDAPVIDPAPRPSAELSEGQQMIVNVLSKTRSQTLDFIAKRTGLNALYIMLECRNLAELGIVAIDSTSTVRKYRLEVSRAK